MSPTPPAAIAMLDDTAPPQAGDVVYARIRRLLIPFMFLLYVFGYLDRINIGFAALSLQRDRNLSEMGYAVGSGIFFVGYFLFEVPSNLILSRIGARKWIARIMLTWGVLACAMVAIRGPWSFGILRVALGAAEAGFFPGMVLYLTYWFPSAQRARAIASFLTATAIAGAIGAPISWACLKLGGAMGLTGWQWLFLLEGLPSVLLGFAVLAWLPNGPRDARWLNDQERDWLESELITDRQTGPATQSHSFAEALRDGRLWLLTAIYFFLMSGLYGFSFYAAKILKASAPKWDDARVVLWCAIPYTVAATCMVAIARHSDRTNERRWHVAGPAFIAALGLVLGAFAPTPSTTVATLSLAAIGIWGVLGTFWTLPTSFLRGTAAAGGIAVINSIGCLAGFATPWMIGTLKERTGSFGPGMIGVAVMMSAGGLLVLTIRSSPRQAGKPGPTEL